MEYTSTITCQFHINNHEANSKEEYIKILKEYFYENHSISLRTNEITNIQMEQWIMERDIKKIIETLQKHEADTDLLNDVMVMLLNNQIEVAKNTKKALLTAREHIENNDETTQKQIDIIRDFVVMLAEKITKLEAKLWN